MERLTRWLTADKANFSPRIGFAWTPTASADTVVRGAYGVFFSGQEIRTAAPLQLAYNLPFFYEPAFFSDGVTPVITVSGGFPTLDPSLAINPERNERGLAIAYPVLSELEFGCAKSPPGIHQPGTGIRGLERHASADSHRSESSCNARAWGRSEPASISRIWAVHLDPKRGNSIYHSFQAKGEKHTLTVCIS